MADPAVQNESTDPVKKTNTIEETEIEHIERTETATMASALEKLRSVYGHPGPYLSVYLQTLEPDEDPTDGPYLPMDRRWAALREGLVERNAPTEALDAIEAQLQTQMPEDTAGVAIIVAHDGYTIVDYSLEPPRRDFATVETLPYVAPLLETDQYRIPHLVVTIDGQGAEVVEFGVGQRSTPITTLTGGGEELAKAVAAQMRDAKTELVVIAGEAQYCRPLSEALTKLADPECRVVVEDHGSDSTDNPDEVDTVEELADATVRYVFDTAARTTVDHLREFRFLASHRSAVDGVADTIAALQAGTPDVLLVHDDPEDLRRVWIGPEPIEVSVEHQEGFDADARFVDAAIRSAVAQSIEVHIIPSTGWTGPQDNVAALTHNETLGTIT